MFFLCIIYLNRESDRSLKFVDMYTFIYFELKNEINLMSSSHCFFFLFSSHASFFFVSCGHAYLSSFVFFSFPSFVEFYSVRLDWIWLLKIIRFIEKIQFFFMITKLSVCLFSFSFQNIPFLLYEIMMCIIHRYW